MVARDGLKMEITRREGKDRGTEQLEEAFGMRKEVERRTRSSMGRRG